MENSTSSKKIIFICVILCFLLSIIFGGGLGLLGGFLGVKYWQQDTNLTKTTTTEVKEEESATIAAVEKAGASVVSIVISQDVPTYEQYMDNSNPFFSIPQYRQNGTETQQVAAGTGFIISQDGYILTNRHVVSLADASYTVFMQNGDKYDAKVLAKDTYTDLAVLKIEANNLPTVELGDSANLKPGQTVIAIGYALGEFKNSVSKGVISGLSRTITAGDATGQSVEQLENIIQTDAAINQGNSGGPLLDINGQVIGVNVAMASGSENIGFAITVNDAKVVIDSVKNNGKISRPFLGVRYVPITSDLIEKNQLTVDHGVLVLRGETMTDLAVIPGSPADKAGIVENDIILEVDGKKIDEENVLKNLVNSKKVGDVITLKIIHQGQEKEVTVTLEERNN